VVTGAGDTHCNGADYSTGTNPDGNPGLAGQGGGSTSDFFYGGGGGGGYFGGGAGGDGVYDEGPDEAGNGGGGGGSSYGITGSDPIVDDTGNPSDDTFNDGNGEITISYTVAAATTTTTVPGTTTTTTTAAPVALAFTGTNLYPLLIAAGSLVAVGLLILRSTATRGRHRKRTT
jgi:hypothetical protein